MTGGRVAVPASAGHLEETVMTVARRLACLGFAALLPAVAMAQDVTAQFRHVTDYDQGRLQRHRLPGPAVFSALAVREARDHG